MDNENKEFQGNETDANLSPEEKVKNDISSKIAEAADEVRDEIIEASGSDTDGEFETSENTVADESWENTEEEAEKPAPVKVSLKKSSFVLSLIGAMVLGALVLFLCLKIPAFIESMPEGTTVAKVNGEKITDLDVRYYIYAQAMNYASKNGIPSNELKTYDWDQEIDGKKLSDTIRENALEDAINEVLTIQKGEEQGITLSDDEKYQIDMQIRGLNGTYGEDGFTLRTRTMGITSPKQYEKMYYKVMAMQKVQEDMVANRANYYPEDEIVLNNYLQPDKASVKHILFSTDEDTVAADSADSADENAEAAATPEEKFATAQTVLERAKSGEDFDALVAEFNEDPGATEAGYNFSQGDMVPEFEEAAFALKLNEISDIVESDYGYHIIKRIPGPYELEAYWKAEAGDKITSNSRKIAKLSVGEIMADVQAANDEIAAQVEAGGTY